MKHFMKYIKPKIHEILQHYRADRQSKSLATDKKSH